MSSHGVCSGNGGFATTRWSVVLAAGGDDSADARTALAALCETYWYPLYAYIRRQGHDAQTAQDLTQGFFARLLEKRDLDGAAPERGRFRSYLLAAVKHYLANQYDQAQAQKRGGGRKILSLDFGAAEDRYRLEPADRQTPEALYLRQWALTLLERVQQQLEGEARRSGNAEQFACLRNYLTGGENTPYSEAAARLGMTEGAVKTAVHRLRRRFGERLREEIAQTVPSEEQIDDEVRALFEALRS